MQSIRPTLLRAITSKRQRRRLRPRQRGPRSVGGEYCRRKQSLVTIRHVSGHRVVAVVEVVSPGNKATRQALEPIHQEGRRVPRSGRPLADHRPAGMDARLGDISRRESLSQLLNDHRRPLAVEALPRGDQVQWRSEVIAERHDDSLQPAFYRPHVIAGTPCLLPDGPRVFVLPRSAASWIIDRQGRRCRVRWCPTAVGRPAPTGSRPVEGVCRRRLHEDRRTELPPNKRYPSSRPL